MMMGLRSEMQRETEAMMVEVAVEARLLTCCLLVVHRSW